MPNQLQIHNFIFWDGESNTYLIKEMGEICIAGTLDRDLQVESLEPIMVNRNEKELTPKLVKGIPHQYLPKFVHVYFLHT